MKPSEFIARLQSIAHDARHHPEPAVAVALLARLLLDFTLELEPLAKKYCLMLQATGFLDNLEAAAAATYADMQATSSPGASATVTEIQTATSDEAAAQDVGAA